MVVNQGSDPKTNCISVFEGDKAENLALEFVEINNLSPSVVRDLTIMIENQMKKAKQ